MQTFKKLQIPFFNFFLLVFFFPHVTWKAFYFTDKMQKSHKPLRVTQKWREQGIKLL